MSSLDGCAHSSTECKKGVDECKTKLSIAGAPLGVLLGRGECVKSKTEQANLARCFSALELHDD